MTYEYPEPFGNKGFFDTFCFDENCIAILVAIYATERRTYFLFDSDETGFFTKQLIPGEAEIVEVNEDYLVVYLYNEERYVLYNESMTAILKTKGYMNVTAMADGYLVQTNVAGETVLYVVK